MLRPSNVARLPEGQRVTGRELLVGREKAGFGLYSYLLEPVKPDPGTDAQTRWVEAVKAFARLNPVGEVLESVPPDQVNITYFPYSPTAKKVSSGSFDQAVPQLVENYDYARASVLARRAGFRGSGPYILSVRQPLSGARQAIPPYLRLDLSQVNPRIVHEWVDRFVVRASNDRFADKDAFYTFFLSLRGDLADGAVAIGGATHGLEYWKNSLKSLMTFSSGSS